MKKIKSNITKISGSCLLILLLLSSQAFGQPDPPKLLDKYSGNINVEDITVRLDHLLILSGENKTSRFVVILAGKKGDPLENVRIRFLIENYLTRGRGDTSRLIFVKSGVSTRPEIEFWEIPTGFDISKIESPLLKDLEPWDEDVSGLRKPVKLRSNENWFGRSSKYKLFEESSPGLKIDLEIFVHLLKTEPKMRGNIVIYQINTKRYQRDSDLLLQELSKRGIDRSRLRTFYVKTKGEQFETTYDYIPCPEFWILP